jgi:hypothetical protein
VSKYNWEQVDIRLIAIAVSLLVSVLGMLSNSLPNDDAYAYIRTADIALNEGLAAAVQHYAWVSYSLLIAAISLLGFDLFTSAYLINSLFYALLVYSFLSIVRLIDDAPLVSLLAAFCILLYPQLNEFRFDVIRDVGYWALSLFALWQFLLFYKLQQNQNLIAFGLGLLLAASFRPEAIVYLIVTPFALLFDTRYERAQCRRHFAKAIGIAIGALAFSFLVLALMGISFASLLADFLSVYDPFIDTTFNSTEADSSALSTAVFGEHASSYSGPYLSLFLVTGLLAILLAKLFSGIGGPFFWLLVYGAFKRFLKLERNLYLPIVFFLLTNIFIVFMFILVTRYVSSRYAMLFCLLFALLVPIVLANIVRQFNQTAYKNAGMRILILFFGYCAFDSFISFGDSKVFVYDSIDWIATQSNDSAGLLTNNHAVAYYSGQVEDYDQVERLLVETDITSARPDDLIAIEMHYEMFELVESAAVKPLLEFQSAFPSQNDQQLVVYKRTRR